MYESYTRQPVGTKEYRELLGTAIMVFNSNNAFIIENILRCDELKQYSWHELMDKTSGQLEKPIEQTIVKKYGSEIFNVFDELVGKRNRIMHSFQFTNKNNEQALATKEKYTHAQYEIDFEFLMDFIQKNEKLSCLLHVARGF